MSELRFLDPDVQAYFDSMAGTPALALYQRWKRGETLRVRLRNPAPTQIQGVFEIKPERFLWDSLILGFTILIDGQPHPEHIRERMSSAEFLEWAEHLEAVDEHMV